MFCYLQFWHLLTCLGFSKSPIFCIYKIKIIFLYFIAHRYADLKNNRLTNYTFSFDQMLNDKVHFFDVMYIEI